MDFEKERLMMSVEETKKRVIELLNENQLDVIIKYIFLEQKVKGQKEVVNRAIEFTNKNWGAWCSNHCKYMTELQNILKEVSE